MTVEDREYTFFLRGAEPLNCMTLQRGLLRGESFIPIYTIKTKTDLTPILAEVNVHLAERMNHVVQHKLLLTIEQARQYADIKAQRLNIETSPLTMRLPMACSLPIRDGQTVASHIRFEAVKALEHFGCTATVDVELRRETSPCPVSYGPNTVLNFNHVNLGELQTQVGREDGTAYPCIVGYESSLMFLGHDSQDLLQKIHVALSNTMFVRREALTGTIHWKPSSEPSAINYGYVAGSQDFFMVVKSRNVNITPIDGYPNVAGIANYLRESFGRSLRSTGITGFYLSCGYAAGLFTQL